MSPKFASPTPPDAARTREQLLAELQELRAQVNTLREADAKSKSIANALQESEERLDFSLRSADIGAWDLNLIDHTAWRSPRHDQIFGYNKQLPEWTYEMFLDHVLPEDREYVDGSFQKAVTKHGDWDFECRIRRADGEIRWMWVHGRAVYDAQGQPQRMIGINIDITGQKRMDEELRKVNRAYMVMAKCKEALINAVEEASLLEKLCQIIIDVGGYRLAWIGYVEGDDVGTVRPVARAGYDEGYVDGLQIALEDPITSNGPTGFSLKTGKLVVTRNIQYEHRMEHWRNRALERGYLSTLNLPIIHEGNVIGALVIYSGDADAFNEEEQRLLSELAGNLAYGITAMRDRARRIHAEEELRRSYGELEVRVQERTLQLQRSNIDLTTHIEVRKQAEEALRESEERHRGLYESSLDGIVTTDIAGNITHANPAYQRMLGYTEEELQHLSYKQLTPARWHEMEERVIQDQVIKRGYSDEYEKEYIRKHGSIFPINIRVWLIRDERGQPWGMWGIVRDITDSKWAEEKLRNSERLYRAIGESIDYGVWVCAPDGRNIYASESFLKLVGLTQQQCSDFGWGDVLHPDDMELTIEAWKECVRTEGTWDIEHRYRGVDGQYHPILARGVPVRDEHGKIICWAGINLDISRLKRTEAELNEAKAQAELYLDLMGHDINNMNQAGMGYLEFALETLKEEGRIEEKDKELLEKPLRSIQDSSYLIDNVRKLRSAKSMEYQFQPIDLRGVLESVMEQFSKVNGRQVTINYTPAESHVLATGLVKDVFVNIVGNAVKHSDADKPLEIYITQTQVYGTDESYHKVIIEDNGPGIPDELKTRIFNRLERGNTKAKGKGLGLYLVKTLIHDFNGKIWVEDRVQGDHSKGARFVVILPAVEK